MTQGTGIPPQTGLEVERLIAAVDAVNTTIGNLADRLIQVLSNPPAPPVSD